MEVEFLLHHLVTVPLVSLILSVSSANEEVTSTSQGDKDSKGGKMCINRLILRTL